jgi:hypothetical protein
VRDDRVPLVRFAPVRRRVPLPPYPGAAMTWLLLGGVWLLVVLFFICIAMVAGHADRDLEEMRREELRARARARAHRRGPNGGWWA